MADIARHRHRTHRHLGIVVRRCLLGFCLRTRCCAFRRRRGRLGQGRMPSMPRLYGRRRRRRRISGRSEPAQDEARPCGSYRGRQLRTSGHANAGLARRCLYTTHLLRVSPRPGTRGNRPLCSSQHQRGRGARRLSAGEDHRAVRHVPHQRHSRALRKRRAGITDAGVGVTALAFRYLPIASTRITCRRAELSN
jgi:hypothetical protein